jgi:hypothetical protein
VQRSLPEVGAHCCVFNRVSVLEYIRVSVLACNRVSFAAFQAHSAPSQSRGDVLFPLPPSATPSALFHAAQAVLDLTCVHDGLPRQ